MRVIHVVPAITNEASGPSYSVPRLCQSLIAAGEELTLVALDWTPGQPVPSFMKVFPFGVGPRRLGRSPAMHEWLRLEVMTGRVRVIHNHGMWQMNAVYPGWIAKVANAKLVVSPRGAFSEWAMSYGSLFKKPFWKFVQRPSLRRAAGFHATSDAEYNQIRRLGFEQPIAIIPNGIDVPEFCRKKDRGVKTLLYLGRIHPVKGVDLLLRAWAAVMDKNPDWQLQVAGTDAAYVSGGGYLQRMKNLAAELRLKRIEFLDAAYGEAKLGLYRDADLFVLPTYSENFGMTVAEAQAAGTAAIVTKGAPWRGLETHKSGWWIDVGVEALTAALTEALKQPQEDLRKQGINGREWMLREFSWPIVGEKMHHTYCYLNGTEKVPSWVQEA